MLLSLSKSIKRNGYCIIQVIKNLVGSLRNETTYFFSRIVHGAQRLQIIPFSQTEILQEAEEYTGIRTW